MFSNSRLLVVLLTTLVSSTGCKTTLDYVKEKDSINERKIIKQLTAEEEIKLTYQFKKALSYIELKDFSLNLKISMGSGSLSPKFKATLENSVTTSIDLLAYSVIWEQAYKGSSSIGTAAAIGVIALALGDSSASVIPINSTTYYVPSRLTIGLTDTEVTMMSRQKTLELIKMFFTKLNYDVICELGCIDGYTAIDTNKIKLWLGIKSDNKTDLKLPTALEITLNLTPLIKADKMNNLFSEEQFSHMTDNKNQTAWFIDIKSPNPWSGNVEKYGRTYNDLRSNIFGTVLNKIFFEFMTVNLDGYSFVYRGKYNAHYHIKEGYFAGKTYDIKDSLEGSSLINGVRID